MKLEPETDKLRALRADLVPVPGGVVLKRGRVELRILGDGTPTLLRDVLAAARGDGRTRDELMALVGPAERALLGNLLDALVQRRFLVAAEDPAGEGEETPEDVFYWHLGQTAHQVQRRLAELRVVVVGAGRIARRLAASLGELGCTSLVELDDPAPAAGGTDAVDPESLDLLVAASDLGDIERLRSWNDFCVVHRRPFLPIWLQDLVGQIGPLVIPGETACFECYRMRRATHDPDPATRRAIEAAAPASATGALPPMAGVLGDLAAMELLKLFGLGPPAGQAGVVLEVNLLAADVTARTVLRMPRCPVCTPLADRPSLPVTRGSPPAALRGPA